MDSLIFLMGLIIGAVICYFYLNTSYKRRAEGAGNDLLGRTARAEQELRELRAELARCKQQSAQLKTFEEQFQQKSDECQSLTEKLSDTEARLLALQEHVKQTEDEMREARVLVEPPAEDAPESEIVEEPEVQEPEPEAPEAVVEVAEPEAPATEKAPIPEKADDLRKIEGIGPKVAQHLNDAGMMTFVQLAQTEVERLREILEAAGPAYKRMDPQSWPKQAELAAKEEWDALKELQDQLDGGRYTS